MINDITHTRKTFERTDSGKSWSTKKANVHTETKKVDKNFYDNFVESAEFFNSRVYRGYEKAGYMVNRLVTVSPDGQTRHVDTFKFDE